ncbi:MAG: Uncharacterised protein [Cyanobium sp. ARS6]|nr:MAG: Uncharacterised protein [Cyanobium sp. ARS6]
MPVGGETSEKQNQHQSRLGDLLGMLNTQQGDFTASDNVHVIFNQQTEQQHHEDARNPHPCRQVIEQNCNQQQTPECDQIKRKAVVQTSDGCGPEGF